MTSHTDIQRLLETSTDELFRELASNISKGATAADLLRRGREIFSNLHSKLHEKICSSEDVRKAYKSGDQIVLVAALIDCVSGAISGISPATFCVLLTKEGLSQFCGTQWRGQPDA